MTPKFNVKVTCVSFEKCFCGREGETTGCDTWCGASEDFVEENFCAESLVLEWEQWSACSSVSQLKKVSTIF